MLSQTELNPAEAAASHALDLLFRCIDDGRSFRLEAGAGAGKTHSLIKTLQKLLSLRGAEFLRRSQQVACITYTRVAKEEIEARLEHHPAARADTIHSFCWSILRNFQPSLHAILPKIEKWNNVITENGSLAGKRIDYDLGRLYIGDDYISIRHEDVIELTALLLQNQKFRHLLCAKYPIIFIDEYQDTNQLFVNAIKKYFLNESRGPVFGFFGDHWQRIYGDNSCGIIEHPGIVIIKKQSNFRSASVIVSCLNRMRPELAQKVSDTTLVGSVRVYHTNNWIGTRRDGSGGGHWKGDTPEAVSRAYLSMVVKDLENHGWDFSPLTTKILMLTHSVLAKAQGYQNLLKIYEGQNDRLIKKEDVYIGFFCDVLEPICVLYEQKKYGEMFSVLNRSIPPIISSAEKKKWSRFMDGLLTCCRQLKIGDVVDYIRKSDFLQLPERLEEKEQLLSKYKGSDEPLEERIIKQLKYLRQLREISYDEITKLNNFINGHTPFETNHGVKGAEFENVLVVVGRGWNQYNFDQMLTWAGSEAEIPAGKRDTFERNRNLFYVACSRPKKRIAILFTQFLSDSSINTLVDWFGRKSIFELPSVSESVV